MGVIATSKASSQAKGMPTNPPAADGPGPERIDNAALARYEGFQSFIKRSAGEPDVDEADDSGEQR